MTRDILVTHPNNKYGNTTGKKNAVSEETSESPEESQLPVDEAKLVICPCQKIPAPQLLALESLGDLVLDDARNPGLDVLKDVTELKLPLECCSRNFLSSKQPKIRKKKCATLK